MAEPLAVLIAPDDHWWIWTILFGTAALCILLEQKNRIAQKITGPVLAIFGGLLLSNVGVLPFKSPSYEVIDTYVVPLVIPLLLMRMNIIKVIRETGRMFAVFHFASIGTFVGGFVAVWVLHAYIADASKIGAAMTASYIGGGVNFFAMVATFQPDPNIVGATIVADNGVMALYFLFLIALPAFPLARRIFPENAVNRAFSAGGDGGADAYWKPKPISLLQLSLSIGAALLITTVAVKISAYFVQDRWPTIVREVLGQKFLTLTTLAIAFPLAFPRFAEGLAGAEELGTFLIYVFFVSMGLPASLHTVIFETPLLLAFCALMLFYNFIVTFGLAKLFGYEMEEAILCAVVSSGGPMNGAAISISKGWTKLVFPSVLAGIWGYVIGNYVGYAAGKLFLALFG